MKLSHLSDDGSAVMVDISDKDISHRVAKAMGKLYMSRETIDLAMDNNLPKGGIFECSKIAGIMGAKKTWEFIPMCHQIPLNGVDIEYIIEDDGIAIFSTVTCDYKTGAEMEALTAVSICALTLYDMCKAVDKSMVIGDIKVISKSGGKSSSHVMQFNKTVGVIKNLIISPLSGDKSSVYTVDAKADYGVVDDKHSDIDSPYAVSIYFSDFDGEYPKELGLCLRKFYGNIEISGIDGKDVKMGDILVIGDTRLEINKVDKSCFPECELHQSDYACPLKNGTAYGQFTKGGTINIGDRVELVGGEYIVR